MWSLLYPVGAQIMTHSPVAPSIRFRFSTLCNFNPFI